MTYRTQATRSTFVRHITLAVGALALVGTATFAARPAPLEASTDIAAAAPADAWLKNLRKHRQFFDSPAPEGGIPLVHIMNYYDTYNKAYGVQDKDITAVGTFYGATTFYGLNDAMWAKYKLGEFLKTNDASGRPATANPWRSAPHILGMTIAPASVEALQARGTRFILCNNALGIFAGMLANARGLDASVVYEDLKANILPGVELIPGMVVAVDQAQQARIAYHRQ